MQEMNHWVRRQTIGDTLRRSRLRHPEKIALKWKSKALTYRQLDEQVNQLAHYLLAAGIKKGERVAALATNCLDVVIVHYAAAKAGAIYIPINTMFNPEEVRYILHHSQPAALFVTPDRLEVIKQAISGQPLNFVCRCILDDGKKQGEWAALEDCLAGQPADEPETEVNDGDVVDILYTSGTETRPKGVMLTHQNLITEYVSCIIDFYFAKDDILLHAMPLFHSAQLHAFLGPSLYLGSSGVIVESPQPQLLLETLSRERVTQFFCPPTVWIVMTQHPDFKNYDLSALRKVYFGASATPAEVIREAARNLPQVRFWNTYGQTEVAPFATVLQPEEQLTKLGTVGRACINMETQVVDEEDRPVPPRVVGEIVHRSPHVMLGYYNDPEKTREAFKNDWFHTGDLGYFDEDGYLTVVDRKKDMIKTGGENVSSLEVEEVIYQHPAVSAASVIGVPHPRWIEAVTAVVVPKPGHVLQEDELIAFCRERLAPFKVPKCVILTDNVPKTPSGKILKRELRELYRGFTLTER